MITRITIEFISHAKQRYDTIGDWRINGTELNIFITRLPEHQQDSANAVAVHELSEALLCYACGIETKDVDRFDLAWSEHDGLTEPGDDPLAPYYDQHQTATLIERIFIDALGLRWHEHDAAVAGISPAPKQQGT